MIWKIVSAALGAALVFFLFRNNIDLRWSNKREAATSDQREVDNRVLIDSLARMMQHQVAFNDKIAQMEAINRAIDERQQSQGMRLENTFYRIQQQVAGLSSGQQQQTIRRDNVALGYVAAADTSKPRGNCYSNEEQTAILRRLREGDAAQNELQQCNAAYVVVDARDKARADTLTTHRTYEKKGQWMTGRKPPLWARWFAPRVVEVWEHTRHPPP